jgi:hypothetical protein
MDEQQNELDLDDPDDTESDLGHPSVLAKLRITPNSPVTWFENPLSPRHGLVRSKQADGAEGDEHARQGRRATRGRGGSRARGWRPTNSPKGETGGCRRRGGREEEPEEAHPIMPSSRRQVDDEEDEDEGDEEEEARSTVRRRKRDEETDEKYEEEEGEEGRIRKKTKSVGQCPYHDLTVEVPTARLTLHRPVDWWPTAMATQETYCRCGFTQSDFEALDDKRILEHPLVQIFQCEECLIW